MNLKYANEVIRLKTWRLRPDIFFNDIWKPLEGWYHPEDSKHAYFMRDMSDLSIDEALLCSARGTGKTLILGTMCLLGAGVLTNPLLPKRLRIPKSRYDSCIVGGSMRQSKKVYEYAVMATTRHPFFQPMLMRDPTTERIDLEYGSIFPLPASEKAVRSPHTDLLIVDEAVEAEPIIEDCYSINATSLFPRTIYSSTPHEELTIFVSMWENADKLGMKAYGYISWSDCWWITASKIAKAKTRLSEEKYCTDVLGKPYHKGGAFFKTGDIKACQVEVWPPYNKLYPSSMGIDWGYFPSPTVITICQQIGDMIYVIHQKDFHKANFEEIKAIVLQWNTRYNVMGTQADSSHIGENQRLIQTGIRLLPVKFKTFRLQILENLKWLMENQRIRFCNTDRDGVELTNQLRRFQLKKKPGQDRIDSLALAVMRLGDQRQVIGGQSARVGQRWNEEKEETAYDKKKKQKEFVSGKGLRKRKSIHKMKKSFSDEEDIY